MNIRFNGVVSGIAAGDALTKVEVALAVGGETADQAVSAGRVIEITNGTELTEFQNSGTIKAVSLPNDRTAGVWRKFSINITGNSSAYMAVDGIVLYTGTLPVAVGRILRLGVFTVYLEAVSKIGYFSDLSKDGGVIDDLTSVVAGVNGWSEQINRGVLTQNQSIAGRSGVKFTSNAVTNGNVQWEKDLGADSTGLYEVYFYDPGEVQTAIRFQVYDSVAKTNNVNINLVYTSNFQGFSVARTGVTDTVYFKYFTKFIPSVRCTESRGGTGAFTGAWTAGSLFTPAVITPTLGVRATNDSNSVVLNWSTHTDGTVTGYYIYRGILNIYGSADSFSYVGYSSSTTYTDNTVTNGTLYAYQVRATNGSEESSNMHTVIGAPRPTPVFEDTFESYSVGSGTLTGWTLDGTGPASVVLGVDGVSKWATGSSFYSNSKTITSTTATHVRYIVRPTSGSIYGLPILYLSSTTNNIICQVMLAGTGQPTQAGHFITNDGASIVLLSPDVLWFSTNIYVIDVVLNFTSKTFTVSVNGIAGGTFAFLEASAIDIAKVFIDSDTATQIDSITIY